MKLSSAFIIALTTFSLVACSSSKPAKKSKTASAAQTVRIKHITRSQGGQELILRSMDLVGTPYRWSGTDKASGFDCSGMVYYVYQQAFGVNLPRSSRDMAAASRTIKTKDLQTGDLVFFNTSGSGVSHVGLYIGNGEFIHSPRAGSTIQTERLDKPYYAQRLVKAGTFFER